MQFISNQNVIVVGHKNPDTDSVCSAVAYAYLKNKVSDVCHTACRAGELNFETSFVLDRFGIDVPPLCEDVSPQLQDIDIRRAQSVRSNLTVREAWETMRDSDISTLPVTDEKGRLMGIIALRDIAVAQMDSLDTHALSDARTPYGDIARTLGGTVVCGSGDDCMESGHILIGAGNPEAIRAAIRPGDLMLVSNRTSAQMAAIEAGAACVVVCLAAEIDDDILTLAGKHNCVLISTPYDTYKAAYFINQSIPIRHYLKSENLITFNLSSPVDDVITAMGNTRYIYFPVLDNDGRYYGLISRRNLLNMRRKKLILVDHNEAAQSVSGAQEAEILEIIDHHRVGGLQTSSPIFFRNQPVGCTATIIYNLFLEQSVEIPKDIAGILCCAILSDTLMFRSPTCTGADVAAANSLASMAGEDIETLGEAMFEASENLVGVSGADILMRDYKEFSSARVRFGVGQANFLSPVNMANARKLVAPILEYHRRESNVDMLFFMLTDIRTESSEMLCAGEGAEELIREAFGAEGDSLILEGMVSRKKQLVPKIISCLHRKS